MLIHIVLSVHVILFNRNKAITDHNDLGFLVYNDLGFLV